MTKQKVKLSPGDRLSILIASIALISAIFTTYIQFFHKTTEFRIGSVDFSNTKDSLNTQLDISVLLINTGTNPVAFPEWSTFLSSDESLTEGVCYEGYGQLNPNNTGLYTYGCSSRSNIIIETNTVEFVELKLKISNDNLTEFIALNPGNEPDETPFINVGIRMKFIDSNGKKVIKEFIIGAVQYTDYSFASRIDVKSQKELKVY
jgi:hypothetical protein